MRGRSRVASRVDRRFIIDNSVLARLPTSLLVVEAFKGIVSAYPPDAIMICPPTVAEFGFSARSGRDHTKLMTQLAAFAECPNAPTSAQTLAIQNALWDGGLLRAVGALDTVIAAYALANDATVLHYDRDFEHIAAVVPGFAQRWIVPSASLG
jgi:predicted nucleic acid-binding protein